MKFTIVNLEYSGCEKMMIDEIPETNMCRLEIDGPIAKIILTRTDVFNALNTELISEIIECLEWTAQRSVGVTEQLHDSKKNPYLRVLILSSEGKHFCAGADINMMRDAGSKSEEENREDSKRLDRLFHGLWSHPCFTIACIQGVALGGGAGLISCIDYVIAEPNTKIALSEAKLGISAAVIGPYVYRRIGSAQYRRLAMLASRINSDEALRIGFVDKIVDSIEDFSTATDEIVSDIMTSGPISVTSVKNTTLTMDRWNSDDQSLRDWTLDLTSKMRGSDEGQEGLTSFIEGRKPSWIVDE
tara:strand:- start:3310 stop:4212 length:903 start_codon:yes stop_codon:yes gene_type:complete